MCPERQGASPNQICLLPEPQCTLVGEFTRQVTRRGARGGFLKILGIDTSCDDTSCAVVLNGRKVLSSIVSSQVDLHERFGGVVPEIASRKHMEMMIPVVEECLAQASLALSDLDGIAVTYGPGLLGSLLVGVSYSKSLAYGLGLPLAGVHHLEGHISANFLRDDPPPFPLLNLVVSGGHSDLILMRDHGDYSVLGETLDDAAGEVFDKVARELGLPYPGGPHLDKVADLGDEDEVRFTHPKIQGNRFDFSFSGTKTRALQEFEKRGASPETVRNIAAGLRKAIVRDLLYNVPEVMRLTGARAFAVSGGVAANSLLRKEAEELSGRLGVPLYIPPKEYCTDNGAMIASAGYFRLMAGKVSGPDLSAEASLPLTSW
ncbi:MAG: tRNA (adenosine(37)-N6)-threonylcarbamoyltransferase complex transferase subunit TsaD [Firmicutes bacterium]|jgi:N6-L-threonylcarbamoyladenine synthase|nr:tRNA (adenosine(37)-N6)-threonylcarbamoyltransferase complex transferase subunit TsaD [Candidatus Fermentithermobacillaceae bacterium]